MEQTAPKPLTECQQRWLDHIRAAERAGHPLKAYALEHGLSVSALYAWKAKLKRRGDLPGKTPGFTRVQVTPPASGAELRIRLPNGIVMEAPGAIATAVLVSLVEALGRLS
ncbi:MAG: hypothetical protein GWN58_36845 [Anaerolineae bacterium]|nr:hypothetical protein [Anaerolineae bacterium]